MNAGTDVERSIAQWLVEESPGRAPDRILANAATTIDRTKQRRFAVAWREPVTLSMRWLAFAAMLVVVAIVGAGWIGRSSATVGAQPTASPGATPQPTVHVPTLAEYKAARDAICIAARPERAAYDARIGTGLTDPTTLAADRQAKLTAFIEFLQWAGALSDKLDNLEVPPAMVTDEAIYIARGRDVKQILDQEVALIEAGKFAEADAVDLTTNPINGGAESFESKYNLEPCP